MAKVFEAGLASGLCNQFLIINYRRLISCNHVTQNLNVHTNGNLQASIELPPRGGGGICIQLQIRIDAQIRPHHPVNEQRELRKLEIEAQLNSELNKVESSIRLAAKQTEEAKSQASAELARTEVILAQEHVMGRYPVSPLMFKPKADYLLRVSGMSMKDVGIMDGDWLAVHKTNQARNGQIVVARIEGDATVKRLKLKGHHAYLIAENPDFLPIIVDLNKAELDIEGLVVGVVRTI